MNVRIYRCGYCGAPTTADGCVLDKSRFNRVVEIIARYGDKRTTLTMCGCYQPLDHMNQVSREMALDAGDPSLEGQWIN